MPRARKHPDAVPAEVARDWLEEAAAFLDSEVGRDLPNGDGLDSDARAFTIRFLRAAAAGKPLAFKRGKRGNGQRSEAVNRVQQVLASGEANDFEAACLMVAQQMGISGPGAKKVQWYCQEHWGQEFDKDGNLEKGIEPVPAEDFRQRRVKRRQPPKP